MLKLNKICVSILSLLMISLSSEASPSYKSFFHDNSVLIYGTQKEDQAKFENITAFNLKKNMNSSILLSSDEKITENNLRNKNLVIVSVNKSNSLLNFLNIANINKI